MATQNNNTSKPTPPNWKALVDKYWHYFRQWSNDYYDQTKARFSLRKFISVGSGAVSVIWLLSGFYIVDQGNRGVVSRFGAYQETSLPGLNWHLPAPLEAVKLVNVEQQRFIEVGYRDTGRFAKASNIPQESLMLTRDENIISVHLAVQYQINNAKHYLYHIKEGETTLKQLTESVVRTVIGQNDMDYVLTEGRSDIVLDIKREIQLAMDKYQSGITIASVNLQDAQPPEEVQGAFEDAIRAREDKQRLINEAQAYSNEIIPKARGASSRLIQEAEAYQQEKVAKALGETERFEQLLAEYEKNPAITRKRLYIEAKEKLYSGVNKIMLETERAMPQFYMPFSDQVKGSKPSFADSVADSKHPNLAASNDLRPSRSKP